MFCGYFGGLHGFRCWKVMHQGFLGLFFWRGDLCLDRNMNYIRLSMEMNAKNIRIARRTLLLCHLGYLELGACQGVSVLDSYWTCWWLWLFQEPEKELLTLRSVSCGTCFPSAGSLYDSGQGPKGGPAPAFRCFGKSSESSIRIFRPSALQKNVILVGIPLIFTIQAAFRRIPAWGCGWGYHHEE